MAHWDGCPRPKATRKVAAFLALHRTKTPELDSLDFSSDRPFGAEKKGLGIGWQGGFGTWDCHWFIFSCWVLFVFFSPIFWRLPKMVQEMRIVWYLSWKKTEILGSQLFEKPGDEPLAGAQGLKTCWTSFETSSLMSAVNLRRRRWPCTMRIRAWCRSILVKPTNLKNHTFVEFRNPDDNSLESQWNEGDGLLGVPAWCVIYRSCWRSSSVIFNYYCYLWHSQCL